jgi:hypothetical protein
MNAQDRPRPASSTWPWAAPCLLVLVGCGTNPESLLLGKWDEVAWSAEKVDDYDHSTPRWIDGVSFPEFAQRRIVRHEAEKWVFQPERVLEIVLRDGRRLQARWRLKGRGHVLTIRYPDTGELEVYDIKELTRDRLVLHYDMGMEVRGIAKLEFRRRPPSTSADEGTTPISAFNGGHVRP